jgi:sarcosine oxidase subunit alpha
MPMISHVTSAYWSANCGRSIALAVVENGRSRMGETLYVPTQNETIAVEVTGTVFFDEEGGRVNG